MKFRRKIQGDSRYQSLRRFQYKISGWFFDVAWTNELFLEARRSRRNLKQLKDKYKDQPCVLIGGGPSLKQMDLGEFKAMVSIACNGFYLTYESSDFRPTFYTVEDPLPAKDNAEEISKLDSSIKVVPYDLRKYIRKDKQTIYINFKRHYADPESSSFPRFGFKMEDKCYWGGTVMYFNIQLANHLGCNPIYLVGVDLNYSIPTDVTRDGAVLTSNSDDPNHFDPRYFGKGRKWHMPETDRMQRCFDHAYRVLESKSVSLLNGGVDSKLKTIPKARIFSKAE